MELTSLAVYTYVTRLTFSVCKFGVVWIEGLSLYLALLSHLLAGCHA